MVKTRQFLANAINADEGQNNGKWQVLESPLKQISVSTGKLEETLILINGDLATKERVDTLWKMHHIEHSAKNQLDWVVFVLGLFHLKMATSDTFWRIHIKPVASGFFEYIHHLHAKETGKCASKPGFQHMHNTIHHMTYWIAGRLRLAGLVIKTRLEDY